MGNNAAPSLASVRYLYVLLVSSRSTMSLPVESSVLSKHRLEALADGIFAFALTLLVLDLRLPALPHGVDDPTLRQALVGLLPKAAIWLLSFAVIAASWVVQQRTFALLSRIDPDLLRIELILLALISLFPFSQSVQGAYGDLATASQLYSGHLLCIALSTWRRIAHVLKHSELLLNTATTDNAKRLRQRSRMFTACAATALALANIWPGWNMLAMIPMLLLRWPRRR